MRFLVEWRLFLLVGVGAMAGAWIAVSRQLRWARSTSRL